MASGPGQYHRTFGTPRDRAVERGDMVFMDLSVIVHGYAADFGRAGVIGAPTTTQREAQAATIAATDAAIAVMAPGVPTRSSRRPPSSRWSDPDSRSGTWPHRPRSRLLSRSLRTS